MIKLFDPGKPKWRNVPFKTAEVFKQLKDQGLTIKEISEKTGYAIRTVQNYLLALKERDNETISKR